MSDALFRRPRQLLSPLHIGWVHGEPVRFFAARSESGYPWFALHEFFEAVQVPELAQQQLVRIGRENTPDALEAVATKRGIVLLAEYGFGRGLLDLAKQTPGFEDVISEFDLAARQTVEAMAG